MMSFRNTAIFAVLFVAGSISGFLLGEYYYRVSDFPSTVALRSVIVELGESAPLSLLDVYESEIRRQDTWVNRSALKWNEERIEINLRRYIAHSKLNEADLAQQDLRRAAEIRKNGGEPTAQDIDFEEQLATKIFAHSSINTEAKPDR